MLDKPSFKDLVALHNHYHDYLREKTYITHQYVRNIADTGDIIEVEIRELLRKYLPQRFKVTHGYILSARNPETEPRVSPQADVIIVDTLVPHLIFSLDDRNGTEAVPIEAIVGLFEVKRTLSKGSLLGSTKSKGALQHLSTIIKSVGIGKYNPQRYLPAGIPIDTQFISGGKASNPIIGILSLNHDEQLARDKAVDTILKDASKLGHFTIDILGSLNGLVHLMVEKDPPHAKRIANPWIRNEQHFYQTITENEQVSKTRVFSEIIGYILAYVQHSSGRVADIPSYFFNSNL